MVDAALTFMDLLRGAYNLASTLNGFTTKDMVIRIGLAIILGAFILLVYKKCFTGVMYSTGFAISLVVMTIITSIIILAIGSNLILSLGMVGALSIVRFRSAVKDPMDIVYLFWAIATGIVLGAGFIPLAVFGSVIVGIVLFVLSMKKPLHQPYILIVNCADKDTESAVISYVKDTVKKHVLRSKTVHPGSIELSIEVRIEGLETEFVDTISEMNGVSKAVLVSYNGEYMT